MDNYLSERFWDYTSILFILHFFPILYPPICMCVCMYTHVYIDMHIHVFIYTCIYSHIQLWWLLPWCLLRADFHQFPFSLISIRKRSWIFNHKVITHHTIPLFVSSTVPTLAMGAPASYFSVPLTYPHPFLHMSLLPAISWYRRLICIFSASAPEWTISPRDLISSIGE